MIYYSSKIIARQAPSGEWDYGLMPTYVVAFLNFKMERLGRRCRAARSTSSLEYRILKTEEELETYPEKWLHLFRNTLTLEEIPDGFDKEKEFKAYFEACERAGFSKEEDEKYTQIMMNEWDIQNAKDLAVREGREEGRKEGLREGLREGIAAGKAEDAKNFLAAGVDIKIIAQCTGLDEATIRSL
ncbi:MAG: Rpn family recombination-promoting nuclease/putative transposase [Bacteroidales bacterium]|nr:Rpn family recombination-promoting nuclease/putative transposase [Bacteroidales bacterium]